MSRSSALAMVGSGICLSLACAACTGGTQVIDVVRSDSAGVELVVSKGGDRALQWTLERRFSLGGAEEGVEAFYIVRPGTVGSDATGHIYVLDLTASRVVVFDGAGQYVRTVGRPGRGPGEFTNAGSLAVAPDGSAAVFDYAKRAVVRFDGGGEVLSEMPLALYPSVGGTRHLGWGSEGLLVGSMIAPLDENTFRQALQLVGTGENVILAELTFQRPGMVMYASCGGGLNLPRIFEPEIVWGLSANTVALSRNPDYEIEVFNGGHFVRRIRREVPPRVATEADAIADLGEGFRINFGQGPCTIPPQEMVAARGVAEHIPWVMRVDPTPAGQIWVQRKEVGSTIGPIDVFDFYGAYIGTLPSETPYPLFFLDEDVFAAAEKDDTDIERLVVYRIVRD